MNLAGSEIFSLFEVCETRPIVIYLPITELFNENSIEKKSVICATTALLINFQVLFVLSADFNCMLFQI